MNEGIKIVIGFGVGLFIGVAYYNVRLKKFVDDLKVTNAQIEDIKRDIESCSKELDEIDKVSMEQIS